MDPLAFFQEQDQLMNLSDDDMDEYVARMKSLRRRSRKTSSGPLEGASSIALSTNENNTRYGDLNSAEVLIEDGSTQLNDMQLTSTPGDKKRKEAESMLGVPQKRARITPNKHPESAKDANESNLFNVISEESGRVEPMASNSQSLDPVSNAETLLARKLPGSRSGLTNQQTLPSLKPATLPDLASQSSCAVPELNTLTSRGKNSLEAYHAVDMTSISRGNVDSSAPSSPIEDPSGFSLAIEPNAGPSRATRPLMKQESTLLFDVQERIQRKSAQHSAAKQRPKVMKLASKEQDHHRSTSLGADESSIKSVSLSSSPLPQPAARNTSDIGDGVSKKALITASKKSTAAVAAASKKSSSSKKGKKGVPEKKLNVYEYTIKLQAEADAAGPASKPTRFVQFLQNTHILYVSTDFNSNFASEGTRKRLQLLVKYGARLAAVYDPSAITHIVVECSSHMLRSYLKIRKVTDIPFHIPTVNWNWMAAAIGMNERKKYGPEREVRFPKFFDYEACSERIGAGSDLFSDKGKRRREMKQKELKEEVSRISDFSDDEAEQARSRSPQGDSKDTLVRASSSRVPLDFHVQTDGSDPLAQFYAQAREEQKNSFGRHEEDDETDDSEAEAAAAEAARKARTNKGWACDKKDPGPQGPCANQDIVDKLQELAKLHKAKTGTDNHFRAFSYAKSIPAIQRYPKRITSESEAKQIPGVGERTAKKIMEILNTGELQRIKYERTEDVLVCAKFTGIYGVGQNIALQWYMNGCTTLDDIRNGVGGVKLTPAQQIGLKYYDDINERMPREEAKALFELIKPIALSIDPKLFVEIMGSYRRGKADCGDIDILITRCPDDGITHQSVLPRLLKKLHNANIITEDLAVPEDGEDLEAIYRGLCHLPHVEGSRRRRIDFLTVPWESKGGALLYYTGDDIFNRSMRLLANKKGYSLNQRGLFEGVVRDPKDRRKKLNTGNLIASKTEEEIFKILGVPWQEPHERVRNFD